MFERWRERLELQGSHPSALLAYRRQMTGTHGVLLSRCLLAHWSLEGDVGVIDWDESNAFCHVPRSSLASLLPEDDPGLGAWAVSHYARLQLRVVTPMGLTSPTSIAHGGGQGDSGGVGLFTASSILRSRVHSRIVRLGLHPYSLLPGALNANETCFAAPADRQ